MWTSNTSSGGLITSPTGRDKRRYAAIPNCRTIENEIAFECGYNPDQSRAAQTSFRNAFFRALAIHMPLNEAQLLVRNQLVPRIEGPASRSDPRGFGTHLEARPLDKIILERTLQWVQVDAAAKALRRVIDTRCG